MITSNVRVRILQKPKNKKKSSDLADEVASRALGELLFRKIL